jgi:hypothetical protein
MRTGLYLSSRVRAVVTRLRAVGVGPDAGRELGRHLGARC